MRILTSIIWNHNSQSLKIDMRIDLKYHKLSSYAHLQRPSRVHPENQKPKSHCNVSHRDKPNKKNGFYIINKINHILL